MTQRLSIPKLHGFLTRRAAAIKAEMEHYEAQAESDPGQRDYYKNMAATERCAWLEVLHIQEVVCGEKQDPNWKRRP